MHSGTDNQYIILLNTKDMTAIEKREMEEYMAGWNDRINGADHLCAAWNYSEHYIDGYVDAGLTGY